MKYLFLLILSVGALSAQRTHDYTVRCTGVIVSGGSSCTVQLPATTPFFLLVRSVFAQCAATCVVTQDRDGSAATTTPVTVVKNNPFAAWVSTPVFTAYKDSNASVGTVIGSPVEISGKPSFFSAKLNQIVLESTNVQVQNYNLRVTGTLGSAYEVSIIVEKKTTI